MMLVFVRIPVVASDVVPAADVVVAVEATVVVDVTPVAVVVSGERENWK